MKKITIAHAVLSLISGTLLIGYGGMDDSPGAQGIGLLTAIGSLVILGRALWHCFYTRPTP